MAQPSPVHAHPIQAAPQATPAQGAVQQNWYSLAVQVTAMLTFASAVMAGVCVSLACPQANVLAYSGWAGFITLVVVLLACAWTRHCYRRRSMVAFPMLLLLLVQLDSGGFALLHWHAWNCCRQIDHFKLVALLHMVPPAITWLAYLLVDTCPYWLVRRAVHASAGASAVQYLVSYIPPRDIIY